MSIRVSRCLLLLAGILVGGGVLAQETAESRSLNYKVRLLSWGDSVHALPIYVREGEEFREISIRTNRRSEALDPGADRALQLFTDGVDEDGLPTKVPVCQTVIPEGVAQPLLILFDTGRPGPERFRALVVDDSDQTFPFGSYRVFNFSGVPVAFRLDRNALTLQPGGNQVMETRNNQRENIEVQIAARVDDEPKILKSSYWRHQPSQRIMVFVLGSRDPDKSDYMIRTIAERESTYRTLMGEDAE